MTPTHTITVNGEPRRLPQTTTVTELLTALELPPTGLAVAVNMDVIPRSEHDQYVIPSDARVEVIRAVGGG